MDSTRAQILRMRRVAEAAVERYPVGAGRLTFLDHGENTTFRHDGPRGRHLVRVHRPGRHGATLPADVAIASELAWLEALAVETDLRVPTPLRSVGGETSVLAEAGGKSRTVSVLTWAPGRILGAHPRPVHLRRLGNAMARLHRHADAWTPPEGFARLVWNRPALLGASTEIGGTPGAEVWEGLPADLRARFEAVVDRVGPIVDSDPDTGLIHADLHLGNAVFADRGVSLIDFDDCGIGPRPYDLAVALWEYRQWREHPAFRDALLEGYTTHRDVNPTHIDDYIAARQLGFDLWSTGMSRRNPAFAARLDQVHRWSRDMLDVLGR